MTHEEQTLTDKTITETVADSAPVEFMADKLETLSQTRQELIAALGASIGEVKPKLRGWFHLASLPLALIGGLVLLTFTPTLEARAAIAVYVFTSILLFSVSATYHRSNGWVADRVTNTLQKFDHASISVLIAGTNTPFAVLLLDGGKQLTLLIAVWSATAVAVATKFLFAHPPRWINVPIYIALGWFPIFFIGDLFSGAMAYGAAGVWIFWLIVSGGVIYSLGGLLFGLRPHWLELKKDWFGFHEWFHALTILAFFCHYAAVSIIAYSL